MDRFNKLALGPNSVQYSVSTRDWRMRMFLSMLAISETNAYLLNNAMLMRDGQAALSHSDFKKQLGQALIENPYRGDLNPNETFGQGNPTHLQDVTDHATISNRPGGTSLACVVCKARGVKVAQYAGKKAARTFRSAFQCSCGVHICSPTQRSCFMIHQLEHITAQQWAQCQQVVRHPDFNPDVPF